MGETSQARQRFGARVRALRLARQLTLKQVGAAVGLTETSMSRIELGNQNMKVDDLLSMAALFGVSPAAFFVEESPTLGPSSGLQYFELLPPYPDVAIAAYA